VGSLTWGALFGAQTLPTSSAAASALLAAALRIAAGEEASRVRERPRNSNRGPHVEQYSPAPGSGRGSRGAALSFTGALDEGARSENRTNPMVKTAGCLDHWSRAKAKGANRIPGHQAVNDPSLVRPGMKFIMDYGSGAGHSGFIEAMSGGLLTTIEGNTDESGTREGGGVTA
jgi:hypothetical protein